MTKCPFCGSTAQLKKVETIEGETTIIDIYQCGCGTKIKRYLTRTMDIAWSPTGTMISRKKF